ncbi:hypothetical protein HMF7854_02285 [Sphingomonas ginkgonis]|uniref:Ava_C0101 and related proteins n=1 Tax=Sphingomonas ginkgonis TaxID=2315330 RepID=A0A3R9WR38_9SPHN|nr:DUF5996 family protein [Sphingomonas ginkgonis]RST29781.1 hypothetical protein HMF7854_02285 [Sphingomonas ginkgonis]
MSDWPRLDPAEDGPTFALLHLASQMVGKLRLANSTWENHGWNITLRPTASGLATLPSAAPDGRQWSLALDLCRHGIALEVSGGERDLLPFAGTTVSRLHADLVALLDRHGLPSRFDGRPNEIADAPRFADDQEPRDYRPDSAARLHAALQRIVPIFETFRAGFQGKASPVHFFWGSFDLAVTRFSGRPAPAHPGGIPGLPDRITREAYSHEVSSAGFWPGGVTQAPPLFYSYAYPEPDGFRQAPVAPGRFDAAMGEWVLDYAAVRAAADPAAVLSAFLRSSYAAAADLARWDRAALEREPVAP